MSVEKLGDWTELAAPPSYPDAFAGPWRAWSFGRDLRLEEGEPWIPPERVSTAGIKEEGIETLVFLNLATIFPDWHLRAGPKDPFAWAGADIVASDPVGTAHLFEVKYGASEENVVDQALAYAVGLLREPRLQWFDQQPREQRELIVASRVAGFWLNSRSDKWSHSKEHSRTERLRHALKSNVAALAQVSAQRDAGSENAVVENSAFEVLLADARLRVLAMEPSATHAELDARSSGGATGLHLHLVIPSWTSISAGQLDALARLKFRGLQVSLWEVACQKRGLFGGTFAIREVWVRPVAPEKGAKKTTLLPSSPLAPLLSQAALAAGTRPERRWEFARGNAKIGAEWHGATIPELKVELRGTRVRVRVKTVAPEGWRSFDAGARALEGRKQVVTRWLQAAAPAPADVALAAGLDKPVPRAGKKVSWTTTDRDTGLALSVHRYPALVWGEVSWEHDVQSSGRMLARLIRVLEEVSSRVPEAFSEDL